MTQTTGKKDDDSIKTLVEEKEATLKGSLFYHGSGFKNEILRPGFFYTKEEVIWDHTESNKFLYVTTDYRDAVLLGFSSHIEKKFDIKNFHIDGNRITITVDESLVNLKASDLTKLPVYVYTIRENNEDNWILVSNRYNHYKKEYKTDNEITAIDKIEEINMALWLQSKGIDIVIVIEHDHPKADTSAFEPTYVKW